MCLFSCGGTFTGGSGGLIQDIGPVTGTNGIAGVLTIGMPVFPETHLIALPED